MFDHGYDPSIYKNAIKATKNHRAEAILNPSANPSDLSLRMSI
jgi:hypothetical protein